MIQKRLKWQVGVVAMLALFISSITVNTAHAIPAKPGVIKVEQADGSTINILLKGDEHFNWRTTESGYPIAMGSDGYYYYVSYASTGQILPTTQRVLVDNRMQSPPAGVTMQNVAQIAKVRTAERFAAKRAQAAETKASVSAFPSDGHIRSAVLLVEYSDVKFSLADPYTSFYNQLNKKGYSVEGATGSARDYFDANSRGKFDGQFDVYGPYTLPNSRAYYGADISGADANPAQMVEDAATLANADGVDFSLYDYDNDGYIDNVFVYYAGHNQAEGASSDAIWPHKWVVLSQPRFNGKTLYVYACTSELRGSSGTSIAGIGTFRHEFSHVFGLADHYDTDGSTNGTSLGLGEYDIMTDGGYNNNGNTPPLHNALELQMIGWLEPTVIDSSMDIEIEPINSGSTYKVLTDVENEFFLIENRNQNSSVWETYIPGNGLIITHVDQSTPWQPSWDANGPNNDTSHECFYYVMANGGTLSTYNWSEVPYPFNGNNSWTSTSTPAAKSWSGAELNYNIVDIETLSNGNITFKTISSDTSIVNVLIGLDQTTIYVGEKFTLTSSTYPEQSDSSVTWSSSNPAIATIDSEGNCEFLKAGAVIFTATLDADPTWSSEMVVSATDLQGARGYVNGTDGSPLEDAELKFYPVTRTIETINGAQSIAYTRSTADISYYKTTPDQEGEYRIELAEGYYEVELSCALYNDGFEVVLIEQGTTTIDFTLESYADTVSEIMVVPGQSTAALYWNPQSYTSFKVTYSKGAAYIDYDTYVSGDSQCEIDGLETSRNYTVTVSGQVGTSASYTKLYSTSFTTLAKVTTIPIIQFESYEYTAGETLELNMLNSDSRDTITWYIDDEALETNKVILSSGEHTIRATVERTSDTFRVYRIINVK